MSIDAIDPVCVPDIFATELVSVRDLGGVFRFTFGALQNGELLVVARIALLTSGLGRAREMTAEEVNRVNPPLMGCTSAHH